MPYVEKEIAKVYWTIGEVAEKFNVATSLIRFWETEFPQYINPKKNKKGNRQFCQEDIDTLSKIYHLIKVKGFTLAGARTQLKQEILMTKEENNIMELCEEVKKHYDYPKRMSPVSFAIQKLKIVREIMATVR